VDDACLDLKPLSGREIGDICPDGGRNEHLLRVGHSSGFSPLSTKRRALQGSEPGIGFG